ncbi:hypothetical protein ACQ5SP_07535 [Rhodovulum sp. YNF3179]|uniref:hypothetical protein n=1 Tax=Rhodovulum sp. YNF3179 TaxID=3425127 RepID=UPI003D348005
MQLRWLLRAAKWVHRPPSPRHVVLVLAVVAACLLLAAFELVFGWPDALVPGRAPGAALPRF